MSDQEPSSPPQPPIVAEVEAGYAFEGPALELGGLALDADTVSTARVRIPLGMLNRHGLVAGATGTGKTKTLQLLAEQLSAQGVPVFAADIKGDLSGLATPGAGGAKLTARGCRCSTSPTSVRWSASWCPRRARPTSRSWAGSPRRRPG